MSVPQAMEWLIEHAEDPTIDTPLPGPALQGEAGAEAAPAAAAGTSAEGGEDRDELTEIFKKIRRKREFRADARVYVLTGLGRAGRGAGRAPEAASCRGSCRHVGNRRLSRRPCRKRGGGRSLQTGLGPLESPGSA